MVPYVDHVIGTVLPTDKSAEFMTEGAVMEILPIISNVGDST
jgi:hypothetical protein